MGLVCLLLTAELNEAQAKLFPKTIADSTAATRTALEGTLLYDTFLSADGSRATLFEAYDSPEALGRHMKALAAAANPPPQTTSSNLMLLGDVPEDLKAKFARFGATYFGPLKAGILTERWSGPAAVSEASIFVLARFKAKPGQWDEFWSRVKEVYDGVRDAEPDTVAYEWFMSEAGDEAIVIDVYKDIPALQAHSANSRPRMARLREVVESSSAELFGGLTEEMIAQMTAVPGNTFNGRRLAGLV